MIIRQVQFKNFKSYGNNITSIEFDKESSLNLLVGSNGAGKSSLQEVITYLLYGQNGYTKSEMVNRYNKKFWGRIEVVCDNHTIEVERSISPDDFKVVIDGKPVDESTKSRVQDVLEEYYRIPYFIFVNLININASVSILAMNSANRKKLIDNILNLAVLENIKKTLKEKYKDADGRLTEKQNILRGVESTLNSIRLSDADVSEKLSTIADYRSKIEEIGTKIKNNAPKIAEYESTLNSLMSEVGDVTAVHNKLIVEQNVIKNNIQQKKRQINDIKTNSVCPVCGTKTDSEDVQNHVTEMESELASFAQELKSNIDKYNEYVKKYNETTERMNLVKGEKTTLENNIRTLENFGRDFANKIDKLQAEIDSNNNNLASIENNKTELENEINGVLSADVAKYGSMLKVFEDCNLRQHLTKRYVKYINDAVNRIVDFNSYYINFNPSDFSAEIMTGGKKVTFNTLSSGEKKKLDFCVILGLLEVVRSQVGNINLLFLDELLANVDINACNEIMSAMKQYIAKMDGLNLFVVHHAQLQTSVFDNVFEVAKDVAGFSRIELKK